MSHEWAANDETEADVDRHSSTRRLTRTRTSSGESSSEMLPTPASPAATQDTPFLQDVQAQDTQNSPPGRQQNAPTRSPSTSNFISSPLNPAGPSSPSNLVPNPFARPPRPITSTSYSRPNSRGSTNTLNLNFLPGSSSVSPFSAMAPGSRGSMVLYRLAEPSDHIPSLPTNRDSLAPPNAQFLAANRDSVMSSSGDSIVSLASDSKYPSGIGLPVGLPGTQRGLVPYAYDPALDENDPADEEDFLHEPDQKDFWVTGDGAGAPAGAKLKAKSLYTHSFPWRGIMNISFLLLLLGALLCLFILYPVLTFFRCVTKWLGIRNVYMLTCCIAEMRHETWPSTATSTSTRQASLQCCTCHPLSSRSVRLTDSDPDSKCPSSSIQTHLTLRKRGQDSTGKITSSCSLTSSTSRGERFMQVTILSGKPWICGTVRRRIWSGMTRSRSRRGMGVW